MAKIKKLNIIEIENGLKKVINNINKESFIEEFLSLYEIPKTSITRAKKNLIEGKDFIIKNKLFYREVSDDVVLAVDSIEQEILGEKSQPRYIITTDFNSLAAVDTKNRESLNIPIEEVPSNADFFLAWNGIEKADYQEESPADRKAAERFAKLYDVIARDNPNADEHTFNLFLIRTLFLLFSEDTGIIDKDKFTNILKMRTSEDGSDFNTVIKELFEILDISKQDRLNTLDWLVGFPYVNGKLFGEAHVDLVFSKKSRELLIEAGELLNWNEINPDILGAMIQSVASEEDRHLTGMHYTSVSNIMKVINPLFLEELVICFNDLEERFEENKIKNITEKTRNDNNKLILKNLYHLLDRISKIKFLDPACGSGNFLIIAYKEVRRLEIEILILIQNIENVDLMPISRISLYQFSGIELDDFAHEVAKLSLWIAEHQMNEEMVKRIPSANAVLLPLKDAGNIIKENALQVNWDLVVERKKDDEIYLMGNPPYIGARKQTNNQKKDLIQVFNEYNINTGDMDYISAWFIKGAEFVSDSRARLGFVSTNSISQGSNVPLIWKVVMETNAIINFAYQSFKWTNSAKNNAGVTVVIIGLSDKGYGKKRIYKDGKYEEVENINPYLTEGKTVIVESESSSISNLPEIVSGDMPNDDSNFIIERYEYKTLVENDPEIDKYIRKFIGAREYIASTYRYVFYLPENNKTDFLEFSEIAQRIKKVKEYRLKSKRNATKKLAEVPYRYGELRHKDINYIFIPQVSSENREYVPMGWIDGKTITASPNFTIYAAPLWLLGLLESRMHMVWLRSIGRKLKTDYRYSAGLVYNTFPIKNLSTQRKNEIERITLEILDIREYEGGSLANLYNKEKMPENLREKHQELDGIVDRAYRQKPFESDQERLSKMLELYKEMKNKQE